MKMLELLAVVRDVLAGIGVAAVLWVAAGWIARLELEELREAEDQRRTG